MGGGQAPLMLLACGRVIVFTTLEVKILNYLRTTTDKGQWQKVHLAKTNWKVFKTKSMYLKWFNLKRKIPGCLHFGLECRFKNNESSYQLKNRRGRPTKIRYVDCLNIFNLWNSWISFTIDNVHECTFV